jgi:hypothetical protein
MAYRWPKKSILGLFVPAPVILAWSFVKEDMTATQWWHHLPFLWMALTTLAYGVGWLASELANPVSDMRHNWREWRKVFEMLSANASHRLDQDAERIDIVCQVKFTREVKDARLTVRVVTGLPGRPSLRQIVFQEPISAPKDSTRVLVVGSLAITRPGAPFARHAVWGPQLPGRDIAPGQITMIPGARNIVEISVGPQAYRIYAQALDPTREESTRIYLLRENEFPWPVG